MSSDPDSIETSPAADRPINLQPIAHKLETGAFELFRMWTAQLPGRPEIVIKDEGVLVNDLRRAFEKALRRLRDDPKWKNHPEISSAAYIAGSVGGQLQAQWYSDYITRRSEAYQRFATLKAVEAYLKFDQLTRIRVESLYEHFLLNNANVEGIPLEATERDLDNEPGAPLQSIPTSGSGKVLTLLNNLIVDLVLEMTSTDHDRSDLDVTVVFSWAELYALAEANLVD